MATGTEYGLRHSAVQGLIGEGVAWKGRIVLIPGERVLVVGRAHGLREGELAGSGGLRRDRVLRRR